MLILRIMFLCLMLAASHHAVAAADPVLRPAFSSVISDLPIMPGLTEDTDAAVLFDKPDGRIIETRATGTLPVRTIENFYRQALPALGWVPVSETEFTRSGERLSYMISKKDTYTVLDIMIQPE